MLLAAFCFSIMTAFVKLAGTAMPSIEIAFFRGFVNLCLLTPWMLYRRVPLLGANRRMLFSRSFFGFVALCLAFYAATRLPLADATMLNQTSTIFVALLSLIFLGERGSAGLYAYIGVAFIGTLVIIKPSFEIGNLPGIAGLISGLFSAMAYVSIRQLHRTESSETIVFNFSFYTSLLGLLAGWGQFVWPLGAGLLYVVGVGAFGTAGQICMTRAYRHAAATVVSPYMYSGVLFAGLWEALFWSHWPDLSSILGGALLILSGVGIVKRMSR